MSDAHPINRKSAFNMLFFIEFWERFGYSGLQAVLAMFFVIILLLYLNYIGDESQYSPVMMYYFGLMVGRFVYFDASLGDFIVALKNMFINLPYMLLNLALTGGLSFVGFFLGYFLERNYYIMGVFYTHIFMLICIFIIHLIWMIRMLYYKGSKKKRKV